MIDEQIADLVASLPEEIHFAGGPYCGFFLHPHGQCIHDVHQVENEGLLPPTTPPYNWSPLDPCSLVLNGGAGSAVYVMESGRTWNFQE